MHNLDLINPKPCSLDGRYPHYLTPLAAQRPPDRIVCVDCAGTITPDDADGKTRIESLSSWHAVALARQDGALCQVSSSTGSASEGFWRGLAEQLVHPGTLLIVCWQGARAWALLDLWRELESGRVRIASGDHRAVQDPLTGAKYSRPGLLVTEDPPNIAQLRVGARPGKILWIDCRNWGIEPPQDIQRGPPCLDWLFSTTVDFDAVCRRHNLGGLCVTAASQAWHVFRSGSECGEVHCHTNPRALELERRSHLGGRCEAYRIGKIAEPCYHLDFRSHYGAVMAQEAMPVRLLDYGPAPNYSAKREYLDLYSCAAAVSLRTEEPAYPCRRGTEVIYPVGEFRATLCGPELWDAFRLGRITAWHEVARYEMARVLQPFAERIYTVRDEADQSGKSDVAAWAKRVLVSLAGKLGSRRRTWNVMPGHAAPRLWDNWYAPDAAGKLVRWRSIAGVCQCEAVGDYGPDASPAMASWITSHGRMRLLEAIRLAKWKNVLYVDTDSLIVTEEGRENLSLLHDLEGCTLGGLELRDGPCEVEIRGLKYYIEGGKVTCSGRAAGVHLTSEDGAHVWYSPAPGTRLADRIADGADSVLQDRQPPAEYFHGAVGPDGRVLPHRILKED